MAKIIVLANQKGGVAKTTSTVNLADALARLCKRVLIIDADPQANATVSFGHNPYELQDRRKTLHYALVEEECDLASITIPGTPAGTPSLIPSSINLAQADKLLMVRMRYSDDRLSPLLAPISELYDYILIDTQPHLGILTLNALAAADLVLIPCQTARLPIAGIPLLLEQIDDTRQRANPELTILGILPTIYNQTYTQDRLSLDELKRLAERSGIRVFEPIPRRTEYEKAAWLGKSTVELSPNTDGVNVYKELAKEILAYDK